MGRGGGVRVRIGRVRVGRVRIRVRVVGVMVKVGALSDNAKVH